MKNSQKTEKFTRLVNSAVNLLESRGFDEIRADLDDYTRPATLSQRNGEIEYTPDLTARSASGKCYFEIVTKEKKSDDKVIGKWKLLSTLAKMKNGTFFLLVPRGMMRFCTETIKEYNITADILQIKTNA